MLRRGGSYDRLQDIQDWGGGQHEGIPKGRIRYWHESTSWGHKIVVDYLPFFSNASEVQGEAEVLAAWYVKEMERELRLQVLHIMRSYWLRMSYGAPIASKNSHGNASNGKQKHAKSDELGCK